MTTWQVYRTVTIVATWAVVGLVLGALVTPPAGSDWRSYVVAIGILILYGCTCVAFLRERRRKRRWV
jgi:Sec-independent protein secretion pathway component TatC